MGFDGDSTTDNKDIQLRFRGEPEYGGFEAILAPDRRKAPRVKVQLAATANTDYGDSTAGKIIEISRSGLRLEGDRFMLETLLPNFYRRDKHLPVSIQVFFQLAGPHREPQPVVIKCNIAYTCRATLDRYQMGMQFVEIEQGGERLTTFLRSLGI